MLVSCCAGSGDMVFSLLHARSISLQLEQASAHLVPGPCGLRGIETRVSVSLSNIREGDAVFLSDEGDKVYLVSCSVSQSHKTGGTQMPHGVCPSKHDYVFPSGLGRWPSSHCGGKVFLQTLPQPGCSH